ncbi:MAG TPA: TetR family transcriptional regulator [Micromonosporaceae bacterium]|nr:TetR family transcriptional regulator [Micromonosporaceae bacterium]
MPNFSGVQAQHPAGPGPDEGVRDRRRRETYARIRATALSLVRQHGLDRVTVDMISARAGVSVRTFFNYFPSKVAALVDGPPPPPDDAVLAFRAARGSGRLLADVEDLLVAQLEAVEIDREQLHTRIEIINATPALLGPQLAVFDEYERQLAGLIAERLAVDAGALDGVDTDPPADPDGLASLVAAAAIATVRASLYRWSRDGQDSTPQSAVRRSVATLRRLMAEPG